MGLRVLSPAFKSMASIPKKYTCEGEDIHPPLVIEDIPEGTVSLAIICDDPDAPAGTWVHWVEWNIPPRAYLEEGKHYGVLGVNDFGRLGYGGPCPPKGHGPHRYFFKLYALSENLSLAEGSSKAQLESAMEGKILAKAELVGTYERL